MTMEEKDVGPMEIDPQVRIHRRGCFLLFNWMMVTFPLSWGEKVSNHLTRKRGGVLVCITNYLSSKLS